MCACAEWGGLLIGRVVAVADGVWGKALRSRALFGMGAGAWAGLSGWWLRVWVKVGAGAGWLS